MRRMGLNPRPALHVRSLALCVEDSDPRWSTVRAVASQLDTSTHMDLLILKAACLHETLGHLDAMSAWQASNSTPGTRESSLLFSIIAWPGRRTLSITFTCPSPCCNRLAVAQYFPTGSCSYSIYVGTPLHVIFVSLVIASDSLGSMLAFPHRRERRLVG